MSENDIVFGSTDTYPDPIIDEFLILLLANVLKGQWTTYRGHRATAYREDEVTFNSHASSILPEGVGSYRKDQGARAGSIASLFARRILYILGVAADTL